MRGARSTPPASQPATPPGASEPSPVVAEAPQVSPEYERFRLAVDGLVEALDETL